jgi:hypothetical protein
MEEMLQKIKIEKNSMGNSSSSQVSLDEFCQQESLESKKCMVIIH